MACVMLLTLALDWVRQLSNESICFGPFPFGRNDLGWI
jgi:hypothetical protein